VTVQPGSARAWLLACRPATLTAAIAPVLAGTAVSAHQGSVQVLPAAATFVGAGLLQIASNFANDVFDYEKGADTEERLGPIRAVQAGLITPRAMKRGLVVVVVLALLLGVYLTSVAGWPIVAIGICSILAAIAYTGGPYPLGYHGLGDVFVMLFFGFVAVCGTAYVHLGTVPALAIAAAYPLGAVTTNILVVNNLRDRHTDVRAGKKTLAVRFGRKGAEFEYVFLYATSYLTPFGMWACGLTGPAVMLALLSLPLAVLNIRGIRTHEGKDLNAFLVKSAKLVFLFGATLSAGIFLDVWLR
jgi:1,4-dihydroxy-2-naphthoate polyprenyltransferase